MNYFDLVPSEVLEVLISYLDYDSLVSFGEYHKNELNYSLVYYYHFGKYKNINKEEYKKNLGLEDLIDKLKLPYTIGELKQLKGLNLRNNKLTSLPDTIGELKQLQVLSLYNNKLTSLPENIGGLKQLIILDLGNNILDRIPESVLKLEKSGKLKIYRQ